MKKRGLFLLIILSLIFCSVNINTTTEEDVAVSIFITAPPSLTIIKPVNGTYIIRHNLKLDFSALSTDSVWYRLYDIEAEEYGSNVTLTGNTIFNTTATKGHTKSYILYLYANNSHGTTSRNVTFTVNSTMFRIYDDEFDMEGDDDNDTENMRRNKKGESTDLYDYSYEELQNLMELKFEDINNGKILFNQIINITDDDNPSDNKINITAHVNISSNRIEINSTALPNFNKPATLWFYNLTFSNPRILKDGEICPDSICTKISYFGGTLKFNVTEFSSYSTEETPVGQISNGGGSIKRDFFSIDKERIEISLKQGELKEEQITIRNLGNRKIKVSLESERLTNFLIIEETSFDLEPGESKIIYLNLEVSEHAIPDLYIGKLIVRSGSTKKEILIALEVESQKPLFDVKIGIPERFLQIRPGEEIISSITLFNIEGGRETVDVKIDYIIKNEQEEIIKSDSETIAVKTQVAFIKEINTPEDIIPGTYMIYIKATYNGEVASASAWFRVTEQIILTVKEWLLISIIVAIIIILLITLLQIKKIKKHIKHYYKISEYTLAKEKLIKRGRTRKLKK